MHAAYARNHGTQSEHGPCRKWSIPDTTRKHTAFGYLYLYYHPLLGRAYGLVEMGSNWEQRGKGPADVFLLLCPLWLNALN